MMLACLTLAWGPLAQGSTFEWGLSGLILLGSCTTLAGLLSVALRGQIYLRNPRWAAAAVLLLGWIWASTFWAPYHLEAQRWAGAWTAILGVVLTLHALATTARRHTAVVVTLLLTSGAAVSLALLQQRGTMLPGFIHLSGVPEAFLTGPYYHPSHLSGYLISAAALCGVVLLCTRPGWHTLPVAALAGGIQYVNLHTDSSSGPAVILAAGTPLLVWAWTKRPVVGAVLAGLSLCGAAAVLGLLTTPWGQQVFAGFQHRIGIGQNLLTFVQIRRAVHRFAVEMWRDHPLLGAGVGQWVSEYQQYRHAVGHSPILKYVDGMFVNYAHNDYLQMLAELGVVGLVLFLAVLLLNVPGRGGKRGNLARLAWWAALPIYLFTALYDGHLTVVQGTALVAFALAAMPSGSRELADVHSHG